LIVIKFDDYATNKSNYIRLMNQIRPRRCIRLARTDRIAIARLQFNNNRIKPARVLELLQVLGKTNSSAKTSFSDFSVQCRYDVSGFTKEVTPAVALVKTVIPGTAYRRNA